MKPSATTRPVRALEKPLEGWRLRWYTIIFEADTRAGRLFDQALIFIILLSIGVVMADSVQSIHQEHALMLQRMEWLFTALFTAEYLARLLCVRKPMQYATSFYGVIDLIALLPTYLALFVPGLHALIDVRVLRLLRVFRIFKLTAYVAEYQSLARALSSSRRKIMVFLSAVMMLVLIMGTVMYVVEGPENGFSSIPTSVYWAISTVTTVGFGDITPKTDLGRLIASFMMLLGWGTLAVPTGIVTAEMAAHRRLDWMQVTTRTCHECLTEGHAADANCCFHCGARLPAYKADEQGTNGGPQAERPHQSR
ncbi:Potassium voltage-gated channel subfamily KQT; possible potassium channel, VIC family [Polaromonas sp. CG9_12]|uniref:ion transporter n=1 Tax=Polaromonas sp. CG_9.11 TaxID=2787730 RepID=UPI0004DDD18A|nr:ion transporter [Polaromonas sp. CG_9.11]MBG6076157.1 voltage-gated potassium channel [Polaromonas sp. CG_9.11]CDS49740.1 Potassium voltage-gated channel subfamily KQT; possible potassium channel, VIC family [Polaromonas sp. CG9_12]